MVIMGPLAHRESGSLIHHHPTTTTTTTTISDHDDRLHLLSPFGILQGIDADDLRQTAYNIFFTSCKSSHTFGARNSNVHCSADVTGGAWVGPGSPARSNINNAAAAAANSKLKRGLGLRMLKQCRSRRSNSLGGGESLSPCSSPNAGRGGGKTAFNTLQPVSKGRRKMTLAEIMRQQMKVTEQDDCRLRKTLAGQTAKRSETIILPLELLRNLKPSEFAEPRDYHIWQQRQLHFLECGLLRHPSIPLDINSTAAVRLRDLVRSVDHRPLDTSARNSESMRSLCNSVISLSWRSTADNTSPASESCHWADGYPLNIHIYVTLLQSIFDLQEETAVIDEIDEIFELMKKTWTTLAINRPIHNLCFAWVLFERFVAAGGGAGSEAELLRATMVMLNEVMEDSKRTASTLIDSIYLKMLGPVMAEMKNWAEKRLKDYHRYYRMGTTGVMEKLLLMVFSVTKILEDGDESSGNTVDKFIRSSLKNAFSHLIENANITSESILKLAKETEELALKEKAIFSSVLKKWFPIAGGSAAVTLHSCYGKLLKQYVSGNPILTPDTLMVLQRAGRLEKLLVQMVVEDSVDCEDGGIGKTVVREMVPYEVDAIIADLLKEWIQDRMKKGKNCIQIAKETESWKPMSKNEAYAQSAMELMKMAKEAMEDFFDLPLTISDDLLHNFADELNHLFHDYISFLSSCGSKQSYIPNLPPLTRCGSDSKLASFFKKSTISPSPSNIDTISCELSVYITEDGREIQTSTSRGTQRFYIRLNTLHYLLNQIHSFDKSFTLSSSYFEPVQSSIKSAIQHVSEVAAYRLVFLDSSSVLNDYIYSDSVTSARIKPALETLKMNMTLMREILVEQLQKMAVKHVMKASFEAFLMVLVAGGSSRIFKRQDHVLIKDDLDALKKMFSTCVEKEEDVERESEVVEGVIELMGETTEQLVEDFSIMECESSGINGDRYGHKLAMPATTGKWNRSDPNTIVRVLCHRKDSAANNFLKRTFQLARRV